MGITGLLPVLRSITDVAHVRELSGLCVGIDSLCWVHRGLYACAGEIADALEQCSALLAGTSAELIPVGIAAIDLEEIADEDLAVLGDEMGANIDVSPSVPPSTQSAWQPATKAGSAAVPATSSKAQGELLARAMRRYVRFCEDRLDLLLSHGIRPYFVFDGSPLPAKAGKEEERRANRAAAIEVARRCQAANDSAGAQTAFARAIDASPQLAYEFLRVLKRRNIPFVVAPYEADAQLAYLAKSKVGV
jgi:hypothetical protein